MNYFQPQHPVPIDPYFGDRLEFAIVPSLGAINLAKPSNTISRAAVASTPRYGTYGAGELPTNTSSLAWTISAQLGSGGYTLFSIQKLISGATESIIDDDDNSTRAFQYRHGGSSNIQFIPFSGGTPATVDSTAVSVNDMAGGFPSAASVTSGGAISVYYRKSKTTGSLGGAPTTPTGTAWLGGRRSGSQFMSTTEGVFLACGWSRVLNDTDVFALMDNPWLVFDSAVRRVYQPAASAGATFQSAWARNANTVVSSGARVA